MVSLKLDMEKSDEYILFNYIKYKTGFEDNLGYFSNIGRKFLLMILLVIILCIIPLIISSAEDSKEFESGLWPCFGVLSGVWTIGLLNLKTKGI